MRRWIVSLLNFALMVAIPIGGWIGYLDYGEKRHWFDRGTMGHGLTNEPARSRIVGGVLLALALVGLHLATRRWSWPVKCVCAICLVGFLFCTFVFLAFAEIIGHGPRMP